MNLRIIFILSKTVFTGTCPRNDCQDWLVTHQYNLKLKNSSVYKSHTDV